MFGPEGDGYNVALRVTQIPEAKIIPDNIIVGMVFASEMLASQVKMVWVRSIELSALYPLIVSPDP